MAVLTASVDRPVRLQYGAVTRHRAAMAGYTNFAGGNAAHTIYKGSLVVIDESDTDGYVRAVPLVSSINMTGSDIFMGVSSEEIAVTSSDLADGSKVVSVFKNGVWGFAVGSLAVTDIAAPAYASDDQTITTTSSNALWVGFIEDIDDTYVWVDITKAFGRVNSAT